MRKNTIFLSMLAVLLGAGFMYGVASLLLLRYEAGDMYPPYSSLRADPLGSKAFYEGIAATPGLAAERSYQSAGKLKEVSQTTLFYVGLDIQEFLWLDKTTAQTFEALAAQGNRVVMAFAPVPQAPREVAKLFSPEERWGVKFGYGGLPIQALRQGDPALPATISWHTALYFEPSAQEGWQIIYAANRQPVLIEKAMGQGALVLAADSYFFSNEAMRYERQPELLAWLIGSNPNVVFDETHFGVQESPGIAGLLRKYRLGWFAAALAFLALLFVWRNAVSFVPPYAETLAEKGETGKDATTGLMNLLRQNISDREIVAVCFEAWQKSAPHRRQESDAAFDRIRAVIQAEKARPGRERDPVKCYQTIRNLLREK